jgi:CubicO group peptidase (beta-lactamase class C family)
VTVSGTVDPRFEPVATAFGDVIAGQTGTGAGLAVWHGGRWVVDLWGGFTDAAHTRPWRADTLVMTYSVCKPFAAATALVLADRGELDLDAPIQTYWPEMTARTTMRQVLAHQSGHVVLDAPAPAEAFYDWDRLCRSLAAQDPSWEPGTAHGEAALFYGHLIGEVVRRVDGRSLGTFLRDEICEPNGLDFHIGLTGAELARVADLTGFGEAFRETQDDWTDLLRRGLTNPPGAIDPAVVNGEAWRRAEIPAVNGHGTAKGVAALYVALHEGRILSPAMLATATSVAASGTDRVMGDEREWGLGVVLDPDGFGMGGLGGSSGWWSEVGQYALGFATGEIGGYDRSERLENVVRACLGLPPA